MNEADKALKCTLDRLHTAEIELELAAALHSDARLDLAEIALHNAIVQIERVNRREASAPACTGVLVHSEYERCPRCDR